MLPSTGSNEIQQLHWNNSLGRVLRPESFEALVVEVAVHAVEPRCDPAAARFGKRDPDFRVALAHPAPDHAHAGQHHFHRVADDVLCAAPLETVDADRRHATAAAFMKADREIEVFGRRPERLVIGVVDHFIVVWVRPQEAAAESQFLAREAHLGNGQIHRLHRQHRDPEQAIGIGFAVIGQPTVVGTTGRGREFRVLDRARKQADARIKECRIDAVGIHVGDALVRIEPAGLAVLVRHSVGLDDTLPRADPADPADADPAVADRVLLDDEPILAVFALDEVRRPVSEFRIHVFVPQIQRFEDMAVRIDDIVSATHDQFPSC